MATIAPLTIEEYLQLPVTGVRTELVGGEVIELSSEVLLHDLVRSEIGHVLRRQGGGVAVVERAQPHTRNQEYDNNAPVIHVDADQSIGQRPPGFPFSLHLIF